MADAGAYTVVLTGTTGSTTSEAAVLAPSIVGKVSGAGLEVAQDIRLTTGNTYDQVLLTGAQATITADPGQVTRISYLDLNDDIVQVEFSGAGALTLTLTDATGPTLPAKYNQSVLYMKGHASIVIGGADESTNVSVFSVGRNNAANQSLFLPTDYDGIADIASISIASATGRFGGIRTANANYFAQGGITGICAPGVQFSGPIYVGNICAFETARPMLFLAGANELRITGGDLEQANSETIRVSTLPPLRFTDGTTSHGNLLPARANKGWFTCDGDDVVPSVQAAL